jgi:diketogulonate reductase-like aldo/keto reductase
MYGTAWKEDRTAALVGAALSAGFRAIDTANQRKHYHEAQVGEAIQAAIADGDGTVARDDLFLQTKFTYREGQDHRLPYDPRASFRRQVGQSFESSLEHLGVERIDSYVLHGPRTRSGWSDGDRETWGAMEELHQDGRARLLGVSNVTAAQLAELCDLASEPPAFVQNRCFARQGWDRETRVVCRERGVVYQGFSLLTANQAELMSPTVREIAGRHEATIPQVIFAFALAVGMLPLTGTSDPEHMRQDLAAEGVELSEDEVRAIEMVCG